MFKRVGTFTGSTVLEKKKELMEYLLPGEVVTRWHISANGKYVEADIFDGIPEERIWSAKDAEGQAIEVLMKQEDWINGYE